MREADVSEPLPARRRVATAGLAALLVALAPAAAPRAQTLSGYFETVATDVSNEQTDLQQPRNPVSRDEADSLRGTLNAIYQHMLWPNLEFQTGGLFERAGIDSDPEGLRRDHFTFTRIRPFALLRLRNPLWLIEANWQRFEDRAEGRDIDSRLVRDAYGGTASWYPNTTDFVRLAFTRFDDREEIRRTVDLTSDILSANAAWRPIEPLNLNYSGSLQWSEDHRRDLDTDRQFHNGRVNYSDFYLDGRLTLAASYDHSYNRVEARLRRPGTGGEIDLPVFAARGLSVVDDFPATVSLAVNTGLTDTDRTVPAGLNIGLIPPSGDRRLRQLGLDFEVRTPINGLSVWVDRELPDGISQSFTWELWVSEDNLRWTREGTLGAAPFGPFENRFQIRFDTVRERYVKLVVEPLQPSVPDADQFPVIEITEIEAQRFVSTSGGGGTDRFTSDTTQQRVFAGGQYTLLADPNLVLGLTYNGNWVDSDLINDALTGTATASRSWDTLTASGQVGLETGETTSGRQDSHFYSGTLSGTPLTTLRWSVSGSGRRDELETGLVRSNRSLLVDSGATLYEGLDVEANVGVSWLEDDPGQNGRLLTSGARVTATPNSAATLSLYYQRTDERNWGGGVSETDNTTDSLGLSGAWNPVPSLYLFGSFVRSHPGNDQPSQDLRNLLASWSPFPYGDLRITLRYQESYDTLLDSKTRIYGPGVRWYMNARSYVDVFWERFRDTSLLQRGERDVLSATLRLGF